MPDSRVNCSRVSRRRTFVRRSTLRSTSEQKSISRPRSLYPRGRSWIEQVRSRAPVSAGTRPSDTRDLTQANHPILSSLLSLPTLRSSLPFAVSSLPTVVRAETPRRSNPRYTPIFAAARRCLDVRNYSRFPTLSPSPSPSLLALSLSLTLASAWILRFTLRPSYLSIYLRHRLVHSYDLLYFYKFPPYRCVTLRFVLHRAGKELPVRFGSVRGSSYRSSRSPLNRWTRIGGRPTGWIVSWVAILFTRPVFLSPRPSTGHDPREQNRRVPSDGWPIGRFRDRSVVHGLCRLAVAR